MRKIPGLLAIGFLIALAGCNTMKGAGEDIQSGGEALTDQAQDTQKKM